LLNAHLDVSSRNHNIRLKFKETAVNYSMQLVDPKSRLIKSFRPDYQQIRLNLG